MPLTDTERAALRLHAQLIESYEAEQVVERARLNAPYASRIADLFELQHRDAGPTDHPTIRRVRGLQTEEQRELFDYMDRVASGLAVYDFEHKPRLSPWDTPRMILKSLKEEEIRWSGRWDQLLNYANIHYTEQQQREAATKAQRDSYCMLYRRVMSFVAIAPSVLLDLPEAADPLIGIHRIEAWCVDAMRLPAETSKPPIVNGHRKGRIPKEESQAKRAHLMATLREHHTLKDDPAALARMVGASETTVRRWIKDEDDAYRKSRVAGPANDED